MMPQIFVVALAVIYVKYFKVEISLKEHLPGNNTPLISHLVVTVGA